MSVERSTLTGDIRERLDTLRQMSKLLEPDAQSRNAALGKVAEYTESFLNELASRPVYQPPGDASNALDALAITEEADSVDSTLGILHEHVTNTGHALGSDRFFAYIPSGGIYPAALADYIAAVTNRYTGVGHAAPGAARLEQLLLRWLADLVGYPGTSEGDLTSGGSMATLSAIITAREAYGIDSGRVAESVVYSTSQTHHTFSKALYVAGLGDCVMREVPVDESLRMGAVALKELIDEDRRAGLKPWLIAASAGTTDVGAVDPLNEIADIAAASDVWMHVDAAYGGAFALCDEGKARLAGLGRSDSLILDPHKGFFLPCGTGVVLIRDGGKMREAFHARGVYMQDMAEDTERSACDLSPELTRPFRGLRLWLPFKLIGVAPFRAALEEKLLLAEYFRDQLAQDTNCEFGPGPDLSIVTFRYLPEQGDADAFNRKLVEVLRDDGRIFLTSTTIDGQFIIRMAILGYNTHLESVDTAISVIREKVSELIQD